MGPQDLLDALDEIVYVSDPNTYELLYANRRCRSLLPTRDYKGKPCYALLQGQPALVLTAPMPGSHRTNFTFGNSTTLPWGGIFF